MTDQARPLIFGEAQRSRARNRTCPTGTRTPPGSDVMWTPAPRLAKHILEKDLQLSGFTFTVNTILENKVTCLLRWSSSDSPPSGVGHVTTATVCRAESEAQEGAAGCCRGQEHLFNSANVGSRRGFNHCLRLQICSGSPSRDYQGINRLFAVLQLMLF